MRKRKYPIIISFIISVLAIFALCFTKINLKNNAVIHADEVVYETPDYISVGNLKRAGQEIGNKIVLDEHKNFTYDKIAKYGSVVFKFVYKNPTWLNDNHGGQIHLYNTWQMNGMFWLRPDHIRIAYEKDGKTNYVVGDPISAGTHNVELGRLAIMSNDQYTGDQYYYVKIDDKLYCEHVISGLDMALINSNGIFLTEKSGNVMLDSNWNGDRVTFIVDGNVYKEESVTDDYVPRPQDPEIEGKQFVGWFDKMGNAWDFDKNKVSDKLVLKAGFYKEDEGMSDAEYFSDSNYKPILRFMVSSDVHIGTNPSRRDTNLANSIKTAYKIAENNPNYKNLDATLFVGDISDSGDLAGLTSFKTTATSNLKGNTTLLVSMGNHDFRGASPEQSINQFAELFGPVDQHLVINGYHFISVSPDLSGGEHFSESKAIWLDEQLEIASADTPNKPIFVMQHEHIRNTVYGSEAWYVEELTDVICKYPQVVDFSGHSHYPLADPRSIWQGTFTALGTGTQHYYELGINGYKNTGIFPIDKSGSWSTGASENAQAAEVLLVEVDANNAIQVIAYDLMSDTEITRYYIRNVLDDVKFKYSHTERAKVATAPVFDNNAKLELKPVKATINVSFDQAKCDDIVESYKIEVYEGNTLVKTEYALSDYFYNPVPEKISYTIKGLKSDTNYNVKVYATNVWNQVSSVPLTGNVKTELVIYEPETYEPYDTINILDINYPDNNGILENIPSEGKQYQYPGTATNYTAVTQFYLLTGDLDSKDEFRIQVGKVWTYCNTFWIQTGKYDCVFIGWIYPTRTTDRYKFDIKPNSIYKIEFGTLMVATGEHEGEGYTYLKIDDQLISGLYFPADKYIADKYDVSMHITTNYKIVDINLKRQIEYYVDDTLYATDEGLNGLYIDAPENPTKTNNYFVGWYTEKEGGERIDFREPLQSSETTAKYYARFTDTTYNMMFFSEGQFLNFQKVGKDCEAVRPDDPIKKGTYKYDFVGWKIKGTDEFFDFSTRVNSDIELEAVFEERKYKISYLVDGIEYDARYYVESDPATIIDGEPNTPKLLGAEGHWIYQAERTNNNIYARAIYDGVNMASSNDISLNKFNGEAIDIADDTTRFYLSFANTDDQATWIENAPKTSGHDKQNISFSWNDKNKNMSYLVYFADNEDFENAFIVRTESRTINNVGIFIPGKTYYWKVVGLTYETCSEVDSFKVIDLPVRWISSGTVYNVRDIGGWTTIDNKKVNYGLIYRGGQLSLDKEYEVSYMDEYSFKVFDYLRMKTEIELRGDAPHPLNQFNELENLVLVNGNNYMGMFSLSERSKENYRDVFASLANIDNYPIYFHCSWGADRTGTLAFLINGLLGVPYEQLVSDYELTTFTNSGTRTRYGYSNGAFYDMYQAFMTSYANGGTLQDGITNYLINYLGVSQEQIDSIKNIMLSDSSEVIKTHTVTFMIGDEIYQRASIFEGNTIRFVPPTLFDRHLDYWLCDGVRFDENTKITKDIVLVAKFKETIYEDYDIVTVRDLGLGDSFVPTAGYRSYEGTANTGGRMFEFEYEIRCQDGVFDDGLHVEIGPDTWSYKAHVWFQSATSIHVFVGGDSHPIATYNKHLEYGKTYKIKIGVVIPFDGAFAGRKMFVMFIDDEMVFFNQCDADISSKYGIGIAGTEGILYSTENLKELTFVDQNGNDIETFKITRGNLATPIKEADVEGKIFLGWYDELGNLWNFENNKVLKDMELYARYGDVTINAVVVDNDGIEIIREYKVKVGIQVNEIEIPLVANENLEFDGWFDGNKRLGNTDIITENTNLICKFKEVEKEIDPQISDVPSASSEIENSEEPTTPSKKKGCKGALATSGIVSLITLALALILKRKEKGC